MDAVTISRSRMYRTRGNIVDSVSVRFSYNDTLRLAFRREFSQAFWDPGYRWWVITHGDYDCVAAFFADLGYVVIDGRQVIADPRR
jgi:hypothetical protein